MKKTLLMILGVLFFTSLCFAQDYYAFVEHRIVGNDGKTFLTYSITKTPNEEVCKKVLDQKTQLKDKFSIRGECDTGKEWDKLFGEIFANKPISTVYLSFADLNGYETRIYMQMLTGSSVSARGSLVDLPLDAAMAWADTTINSLKANGIKNAKIIYPEKMVKGK